jgi:hypothetical protein
LRIFASSFFLNFRSQVIFCEIRFRSFRLFAWRGGALIFAREGCFAARPSRIVWAMAAA